jgi:hypothetical protein
MKGKFLEAHNLIGRLFNEPEPLELVDISEKLLDLDFTETNVIRKHVDELVNNIEDEDKYNFLFDMIVDIIVPIVYLPSPT